MQSTAGSYKRSDIERVQKWQGDRLCKAYHCQLQRSGSLKAELSKHGVLVLRQSESLSILGLSSSLQTLVSYTSEIW